MGPCLLSIPLAPTHQTLNITHTRLFSLLSVASHHITSHRHSVTISLSRARALAFFPYSAHHSGERKAMSASSSARGAGGAQTNGRGEGSNTSSSANAGRGHHANSSSRQQLSTLDDVMRAPSATQPAPVLLKELHENNRKEELDLKEDLWLSTADG